MPVLLKAAYRFSAIPIKIPMAVFHRNIKSPKMYMKPIKTPPRQPQSNLEKEKNWESIILLAFKLYCKAILIKIVW